MCPEQVVTLTLVGNIELIQNNPHTHHTKLEMKVQDGPVSDQQSGHLHRTLREHCHLQLIHPQELMQSDLKARTHPVGMK
jgi:hypothetical protein